MFSLENLFAAIRAAMPAGVKCKVVVSRFSSRGFFRRVFNIVEACFRQGDINHITGDVHYLAYFLKKKRTILTIHDCVSLERLTGLKHKIFLYLWYWLPIKRSALVTVISESTKRELFRYVDVKEEKIRVIPDCVFPMFRPSPTKIWNEMKPLILQVGTTENKNLARLAEALAGIRCHLRIIGKLSNEQIKALESHRIEYSVVAGLSDEQLVKEYCDADMVIFVSTYEGFGLPIVEAQASGRPVVTSNILSMPEVAGDGACFADPYDIVSIREAVLKVMNNSSYRKGLIKNGFENVKRFSAEKIATQYVELYKQLIKG